MIEAAAPVRICDIGGWTDTWFGGPGRILNIAVTPGVEVSIHATKGPDPVLLNVEIFGDEYPVVPGSPRIPRHALLEAAIDALPPPRDLSVEIIVRSAVPAGCGTGTSAAVAVALLGGLAALRGEPRSARDIAYAAHRLEVDVLAGQSGIQDQLSSALGGVNYLEIEAYPEATVHALPIWEALSPRTTLVFLGRAHNSSDLHHRVIGEAEPRRSAALSLLRHAALEARDAVLSRDLDAFGGAMIANTEAQKLLHPQLVGVGARRVIEIAAAQGALGWKVNGAGGDGGSLTILSPTPKVKEELEHQIAVLDTRYRVLPIRVSTVGLEVRGGLQANP